MRISDWSSDVCSSDLHARAVERTALRIYEQLAPVWALDRATTLPFLRWAAQLHETGLAISHNSYQKHSEYIVQHSDLQGFSQTDTLILAALLRLHRGKFAATSTAGDRKSTRLNSSHYC